MAMKSGILSRLARVRITLGYALALATVSVALGFSVHECARTSSQ
jgi:hypothetical protein